MQTDDGALFIDRNGDAFSVILEYLRAEHLVVSANVPLSLVRSEAMFYSLMNVVEAIDAHKERKGIADEEEDQEKNKIPREDGFYINNRSGKDSRVLHFRGDGKLTFLEGEAARNNVYMFNAVRHMPEIWKKSPTTVDSYAKFCQIHLQRGFYEVEGTCITIKVNQTEQPTPGIFQKGFLLFPKRFTDNWEVDAFERYNFVAF